MRRRKAVLGAAPIYEDKQGRNQMATTNRLSYSMASPETIKRNSGRDGARFGALSPYSKNMKDKEQVMRILTDVIMSVWKVLLAVYSISSHLYDDFKQTGGDLIKLKTRFTRRVRSSGIDKDTTKKAAFGVAMILVVMMLAYFCLALPISAVSNSSNVGELKRSQLNCRDSQSCGVRGGGRRVRLPEQEKKQGSPRNIFQLSPKESYNLDTMMSSILNASGQDDALRLDDELHRASQRFCVPYLKKHFTLGRNALTNLESELTTLVDIVRHHKVSMSRNVPTGHVIAVDANGLIQFVPPSLGDTAAQCPLLTRLFALIQHEHAQQARSVSEAQLAEAINGVNPSSLNGGGKRQWSVSQVGAFIQHVTASVRHRHTFEAKHVDGHQLDTLTDAILQRDFGITNAAHRHSILRSIQQEA